MPRRAPLPEQRSGRARRSSIDASGCPTAPPGAGSGRIISHAAALVTVAPDLVKLIAERPRDVADALSGPRCSGEGHRTGPALAGAPDAAGRVRDGRAQAIGDDEGEPPPGSRRTAPARAAAYHVVRRYAGVLATPAIAVGADERESDGTFFVCRAFRRGGRCDAGQRAVGPCGPGRRRGAGAAAARGRGHPQPEPEPLPRAVGVGRPDPLAGAQRGADAELRADSEPEREPAPEPHPQPERHPRADAERLPLPVR